MLRRDENIPATGRDDNPKEKKNENCVCSHSYFFWLTTGAIVVGRDILPKRGIPTMRDLGPRRLCAGFYCKLIDFESFYLC